MLLLQALRTLRLRTADGATARCWWRGGGGSGSGDHCKTISSFKLPFTAFRCNLAAIVVVLKKSGVLCVQIPLDAVSECNGLQLHP